MSDIIRILFFILLGIALGALFSKFVVGWLAHLVSNCFKSFPSVAKKNSSGEMSFSEVKDVIQPSNTGRSIDIVFENLQKECKNWNIVT